MKNNFPEDCQITGKYTGYQFSKNGIKILAEIKGGTSETIFKRMKTAQCTELGVNFFSLAKFII